MEVELGSILVATLVLVKLSSMVSVSRLLGWLLDLWKRYSSDIQCKDARRVESHASSDTRRRRGGNPPDGEDEERENEFALQFPGYGYRGRMSLFKGEFAHVPHGEVCVCMSANMRRAYARSMTDRCVSPSPLHVFVGKPFCGFVSVHVCTGVLGPRGFYPVFELAAR